MCLNNFEEWSAVTESAKVAKAAIGSSGKPIDPARVTPTIGPYWVTGVQDAPAGRDPGTGWPGCETCDD